MYRVPTRKTTALQLTAFYRINSWNLALACYSDFEFNGVADRDTEFWGWSLCPSRLGERSGSTSPSPSPL